MPATAFWSIFILTIAFAQTSIAQISSPGQPLHLFFYSAAGPSHFLVVEKKHQRLKLFEQAESLKLLREYTCATGQNGGTKRTSGDSRTPEGIYHITEIYEDKRITVFGSRAFHLDYPNVFDTHAGRSGDGIFIHGTNKKLIPNSTNGCITLNNKDLDELAPYLAVHSVPIIVLDTESELTLENNLLLGKDSAQFLDVLLKISFDRETIPVENIKSLAYLQRGEQVVISVTYLVADDTLTQYRESKRSYLMQSPAGNLRTLYAVQQQDIVPKILAVQPTKISPAEQSMDTVSSDSPMRNAPEPQAKESLPVAKIPSVQVKKKNQETQSSQVSSKSVAAAKARGDELLAFVEKWRTAWEAKDIDTYINCYAPFFKSGELNRQEWRIKKLFLNQKYKYINVTLRNIAIEWTATGANVTFHQTYRSDQLQASGKKTLQLVKRKDRWMIASELI